MSRPSHCPTKKTLFELAKRHSAKEIGYLYNVNENTVRGWYKRSFPPNAPCKPLQQTTKSYSRLTWEDKDLIRALAEEGLSTTEIAIKFETTHTNVSRILRAKGWVNRPKEL